MSEETTTPEVTEVDVEKSEAIKKELSEASKNDLLLFDEPAPVVTEKTAPPTTENTEVKIKFDTQNITEEKKTVVEKAAQVVEKAKETKKVFDIFDDLKKPTEHDSKEKGKLANVMQDLVTDADFPEITGEETEDPIAVRRSHAKSAAMGWVTFIDMIFMLVCMWAADNWTLSAQEAYTLHPIRKKDLQINIFQILMLRKKKTNPIWAMMGIILTAYIPMVILAIITGKAKRREKQAKEMQHYFQSKVVNDSQVVKSQTAAPETPAQRAENTLNEYTGKTPEKKTASAAPKKTAPKKAEPKKKAQQHTPTPTKGKQGRHKLWCDQYDGKPCNCKN